MKRPTLSAIRFGLAFGSLIYMVMFYVIYIMPRSAYCQCISGTECKNGYKDMEIARSSDSFECYLVDDQVIPYDVYRIMSQVRKLLSVIFSLDVVLIVFNFACRYIISRNNSGNQQIVGCDFYVSLFLSLLMTILALTCMMSLYFTAKDYEEDIKKYIEKGIFFLIVVCVLQSVNTILIFGMLCLFFKKDKKYTANTSNRVLPLQEIASHHVINTRLNSCPVCFTSSVNTTLECGHLYCDACVQQLNNCAICRAPSHRAIRLFLN